MSANGIARCYWCHYLKDERGFLTDQPLDPDGWKLGTVDRSVFYELWDERRKMTSAG